MFSGLCVAYLVHSLGDSGEVSPGVERWECVGTSACDGCLPCRNGSGSGRLLSHDLHHSGSQKQKNLKFRFCSFFVDSIISLNQNASDLLSQPKRLLSSSSSSLSLLLLFLPLWSVRFSRLKAVLLTFLFFKEKKNSLSLSFLFSSLLFSLMYFLFENRYFCRGRVCRDCVLMVSSSNEI